MQRRHDLKLISLSLLTCALPLLGCGGELGDPAGGTTGGTSVLTGGVDTTGGNLTGGANTLTGGLAATGGSVTGGVNTLTGGVEATGGMGGMSAQTGGMLAQSGGSTSATGGSEPYVPDPSKVGVFIVQGHAGRLMMTCDGGDTFAVDMNRDSNLTCFSGVDCDESPDSGQGVTYGDGQFVATFGWGPKGAAVRSTNGRDWTAVSTDTTLAGVAYGKETWVGGAYIPWRSDDGVNWAPTDAFAYWDSVVRRTIFSEVMGGRFFLFADRQVVFYSTDGGHTFTQASSVSEGCGKYAAAGNGVVMSGDRGTVCRSDDGGDTFEMVSLGGETTSNLLFADHKFMMWGRGVLYSSVDGKSFTSTPLNQTNLGLNGIAWSPEGYYLGYVSEWNGWYDKARFYRSDDGVNWEETADSSAAMGHPLRHIAFGFLDKNVCP